MQIRQTLKYFEVKKRIRRDGRFQTNTIFGITREDSTGKGGALKTPTRFDSARHRLKSYGTFN